MQILANCFVTKLELATEAKGSYQLTLHIHSVLMYPTLEKQIRLYSLAIILECRDYHWETLRTAIETNTIDKK